MHPCPICGQPTKGSYTADGEKSDLCAECLQEQVEAELGDPMRDTDLFPPSYNPAHFS